MSRSARDPVISHAASEKIVQRPSVPFAGLAEEDTTKVADYNASRSAMTCTGAAAEGGQCSRMADLPTRIIGYAWGESYVDDLLSFALPSLLASGNLPAVARELQCELVLVSEERLFKRIAGHPAVRKVERLCPVRLIGLDDLITRSDQYGMALTYALYRAFADLGPAMTDHWLIFFNADFVLADGSLRNLLGHLRAGERIVASPSYCTVKEDVVQVLKRRLQSDPTTLTIAPRELARLILRHRHITIRGKTINQDRFHLRYADQFYLEVDDNTLVGHQMPVAIVGMRPQKYLREPNAYWDHGLMREFCPTADIKVLDDSDEFLMLELRSGRVAEEMVVAGRPEPRELAERMISWVTPYQASFALRPLTLHAVDVPASVEPARKQLDEFVNKVMSFAPSFPSHTDHPQWDYHWPVFTKIRHAFLSAKLGSLTETAPPPEEYSELDKLWWLLDGAEKAQARRIELLRNALKVLDREMAAIDQNIAEELADSLPSEPRAIALFSDVKIKRSGVNSGSLNNERSAAELPPVWNKLQKSMDRQLEVNCKRLLLQQMIATSEEGYQQDVDGALAELRYKYERLVRTRVKSAGIPIVRWHAGGELPPALPGNRFRRQAQAINYRFFGRWPYVTRLSRLRTFSLPLLQAVEAAKAQGAKDVLLVNGPSELWRLSGFAGKVASMSREDFMSGLLDKALGREQFDLCVVDLIPEDIELLSEIVQSIRPYLRSGARVIGFAMVTGLQLSAAPLNGVPGEVVVAWSVFRAPKIPVRTKPAHLRRGRSYALGRIGARFLLALNGPRVWGAIRAATAKDWAASKAARSASITITITVPPIAKNSSGSADDDHKGSSLAGPLKIVNAA
jgi:hypothetical protein